MKVHRVIILALVAALLLHVTDAHRPGLRSAAKKNKEGKEQTSPKELNQHGHEAITTKDDDDEHTDPLGKAENDSEDVDDTEIGKDEENALDDDDDESWSEDDEQKGDSSHSRKGRKHRKHKEQKESTPAERRKQLHAFLHQLRKQIASQLKHSDSKLHHLLASLPAWVMKTLTPLSSASMKEFEDVVLAFADLAKGNVKIDDLSTEITHMHGNTSAISGLELARVFLARSFSAILHELHRASEDQLRHVAASLAHAVHPEDEPQLEEQLMEILTLLKDRKSLCFAAANLLNVFGEQRLDQDPDKVTQLVDEFFKQAHSAKHKLIERLKRVDPPLALKIHKLLKSAAHQNQTAMEEVLISAATLSSPKNLNNAGSSDSGSLTTWQIALIAAGGGLALIAGIVGIAVTVRHKRSRPEPIEEDSVERF